MPITFGSGAGTDNMCKKCSKRVYEMEKIIADKAIYHKPCFRCVHCQRVLNLGNYAAIDEKPYCKPHFIELFKKKGKYDMGKTKDTPPPPRQESAKAEAQAEQRAASPANRVNGSRDEEEEEEREEPKKEEK